MPLTDREIQAIKPSSKPQKLVDGDGLYLYVSTNGTKSWRFDYRFQSKRYTLTIGKYPLVPLAKARIKRSEARQLLLDGRNPSALKQADKKIAKTASEDNFRAIGQDWYDTKYSMRSDAWRQANKLYLERDLYPALGDLNIQEITPKMLLTTLEQCAKLRTLKTADRVRGTVFQVFEHAILKFKADNNPATRLKRWAEIPASRNRPHLRESEIHDCIDAIDAYRGLLTTKLAAKMLWLTFVRKVELLEATWDEIDLTNAKWVISASRMKMKDAHIVPLSLQAIQTLNQAKSIAGDSPYVFPSETTPLKSLSRTSLNRMFAVMGGGRYKTKFSPHGIRATASTWLNEQGWSPDWIERQLAHSERNQIRASYNHADYLNERRKMMQAWADFLFAENN
ncbi:integrase arm-type DNA-binding domain-containing protein [uncultured Herbaspirillum sp.]|uniref:tyrosine-type recombinase/integrase n=1 Tax=uncultured Herbaspirillum sp. TaxID=160236 RepID=UPI0026135FCE|nr:integrase arm-type DNA-binding domain-containing protein [uncultured Herbaspirillum sp.]